MQNRNAVVVPRVHVRPLTDQIPNHLQMTTPRRPHQSRKASVAPRGHDRPLTDQIPNHLQMTTSRRPVQNRNTQTVVGGDGINRHTRIHK